MNNTYMIKKFYCFLIIYVCTYKRSYIHTQHGICDSYCDTLHTYIHIYIIYVCLYLYVYNKVLDSTYMIKKLFCFHHETQLYTHSMIYATVIVTQYIYIYVCVYLYVYDKVLYTTNQVYNIHIQTNIYIHTYANRMYIIRCYMHTTGQDLEGVVTS